jgi:superfamily II DNA or RNA helicase
MTVAATRAGSLVLEAPPRSGEVRALLRAAQRRLGVDTAVHSVVDGKVWLPRGLGHDVRVTRDATTTARLAPVHHRVHLWPHQQAALGALGRAGGGVVVMPCGSGKTTLGVAALAEWRQRTLVLVHTKDLQTQWRQRVRSELPGLTVGEGMDADTQVVICTVQQLARQTVPALARWGTKFGTLIADEAHRAAAPTWLRVVSALPALHRLALTATPEREDGRWPMVEAHFGAVVHRVAEPELVRAGHVLKPTVRCVVTRRTHEGDIATDTRRNSQIVHVVRRLVSVEDRTVILLVRLVEHAHRLAASLARWVPAAALTGDMAPTQRAEVLKALRAKRLRVVVATSLADEALDVPSVDTVVLGSPTEVLPRLQQRVGRSTRTKKGKLEPLIVDLCDATHERAALAREGWYLARGYKVEVVP